MLSRAITNLGDSALLLPAAFLLAAYLAAHGERRLLAGVAAGLGACVACLLVGKLAFQGCDLAGGIGLRSPSGHTALSGTFYGGLALVLGRGRPTWQRSALLAAAMSLTFAVGASRIRLGAHTPWEVVIGLGLGAACLVLTRIVAGGSGARLRLHAVGYGAALCLALFWGQHLSPEEDLHRMALWMSSDGASCPWGGHGRDLARAHGLDGGARARYP